MADILTDEEIKEILDAVNDDIETGKMDTVDKMTWIQNCVHRAIVNHIEKHYEYPKINSLINIFNIEFTSKFDIISSNEKVYWMCYDMIKILKGNVPYDLEVNHNEKTITVVPLRIAY